MLSLLPSRLYKPALDLGCGTGNMTRRLSALAGQVLGIDVSQVAISQAARRMSEHSNLQLVNHYTFSFDPGSRWSPEIHHFFRIRQLLEGPTREVGGEAVSGEEALQEVRDLKPDLVVMDYLHARDEWFDAPS